MCIISSHRPHFPSVMGETSFLPNLWTLKATCPSASCPVPGHSQPEHRPWGHPAPGVTPVLPAGEAPGPSLSSSSSTRPTGARINKKRIWVQHLQLGQCTQAGEAVINICVQLLLKGHVKERSVFITPSQKQQWDSGVEVESAYQ